MDDSLKNKIAKLMRLADPSNGATEAEAMNALNRAQELCLKHGIEMASISLEDDSISISVEDGKIDIANRWQRTLANSITKAMGGTTVFSQTVRNSQKGTMHIFAPEGTFSAIVVTVNAMTSWVEVNSSYETAIREETWIHGKTYRSSWIQGALVRIASRIRAKYAEQKAEVQNEGNSMALVRMEADVDAAKHSQYEKLVTTTYRPKVNTTAYKHGVNAADKVDIGGGKIGNNHGLLTS